MPMIRPCAHPGCRTLTMGELCVEHEQPRVLDARPERRPLPRVATATALLVAAAVGALIRTRLPR